jgi:hypothetical protein
LGFSTDIANLALIYIYDGIPGPDRCLENHHPQCKLCG